MSEPLTDGYLRELWDSGDVQKMDAVVEIRELRTELAVAQEILLQERELLRIEIAKLRAQIPGGEPVAIE